MAKNLTQLSTRSATADSDLMHVNSGGVDYKQTKSNFLGNTVPRNVEFGYSSTLTSQIDALTWGPYVGYVEAQSNERQAATGMPAKGIFTVSAYIYSNNQAVVHVDLTGSTRRFTNVKTSGSWSGWTEDGILYYDYDVAVTVTGTSSNVYQLSRPNEMKGKKVFSITPTFWQSNTGVFSLVPYGPNVDYVVIESGKTITGLTVRYWYCE